MVEERGRVEVDFEGSRAVCGPRALISTGWMANLLVAWESGVIGEYGISKAIEVTTYR